MAVAPNRDLLVALDQDGQVALGRFTRHGAPERSFGVRGVARAQIRNVRPDVPDVPHAIAFDQAGDAILAGEEALPGVDTPGGIGFLARFTPHGTDCSFGTNGALVDTALGSANAVAVQADGRIVVAGWSTKAFAAARYIGGGAPHTCPGEGVRLRAPRG